MSAAVAGKTILFAVTHDVSITLLAGYPDHLYSRGWSVHLLCAPGPLLDAFERSSSHIVVHRVAMRRQPSPLHDLVALVRAARTIRSIRPDVVSAGTPKAGMLVTVASALVGVKARVYHQRGLPWETATGVRRAVLTITERLTTSTATHVLCVSRSLRDVLVHNRLASATKAVVLGDGSSNGVDVERFAAGAIERSPGVVGFIGRLATDKGCEDLFAALLLMQARGRGCRLVVAGAVEDESVLDGIERLRAAGVAVDLLGHVPDVVSVYLAFDVLCLPTRREGFPNVVLEAGAAGLPTVTTTATGAIDSVIDGITGRVVPVGDVDALADALVDLCHDPDRARSMGLAARRRVEKNFARAAVWQRLDNFYETAWSRSRHLPGVGRS